MVIKIELTAVFQKVPEGYMGSLKSCWAPGTEGLSLEEARTNMEEAVALIMNDKL